MHYCDSIYETKRRKTREVMVGNVGVGGDNPVRIQSMTTSNTRDPVETADQAMRLVDAGCEIVRVTVQGIKEADACEELKNILVKKGYNVPIVADIHFFPPAAIRVADFVEKVRINPGNYVDKRASFKVLEYDDASYAIELERIEEKFFPLVDKCKKLKRALRIGTNHGSLSDRIMNRYGDTPRGMVESAFEFARVCRKYDFHDIIFSMKSSNPQVMILAYRLLVAEMNKVGWDYPLHLGVTEAGEGEEGRIKSTMGIGALLLDGLGDTIRVSLTEDPWYEIDPCQRIIQMAEACSGRGITPFQEKHRDFKNIAPRQVLFPENVAMHRQGTVITAVTSDQLAAPDFYSQIGCDTELGRPKLKKDSADALLLNEIPDNAVSEKRLKHLLEAGIGVFSSEEIAEATPIISLKNIQPKASSPFIVKVKDESIEEWEALKNCSPAAILLAPSENRLHNCRRFFDWIKENQLTTPVILNFSYDCSPEDFVIRAAAECGALLCDRLGDGICLEGPYESAFMRTLSFNILQSARMRSVKTEFISCPSCGRTLFNLQEVTRRIKSRTQHLPGVKIAIMGCIVNGPGEMADADFGYVGSRPGKIDLYVGKNRVEQNIDFSDADDRLIELIKAHGRWLDL